MAGLKVKVVERRGIVGGAAVTEEFYPGFRNSIAAYTVSLLNPKVIRDLRLHEHGLKIVERRAQNFLPAPDGRYLLSGEGRTEAEIAKFSRARRRALCRLQPRDRRGGRRAARAGAAGAAESGVRPRRPRRTDARPARSAASCGSCRTKICAPLYDLFTSSAGDHLDGWFEDDLVKALFGFDAVVGNLRQSLHARHRLRAAASRLRRGERQAPRLGPRHRRHGRDHAGDGEGGGEPRRRDRDRCAGARSSWSSAAAPAAWCCRRPRHSRQRRRGQRQPQAVLHLDGAGRRARRRFPAPHAASSAAAPAPSA